MSTHNVGFGVKIKDLSLVFVLPISVPAVKGLILDLTYNDLLFYRAHIDVRCLKTLNNYMVLDGKPDDRGIPRR